MRRAVLLVPGDRAVAIDRDHVAHARQQQQLDRRGAGGTAAVEHDRHLFEALADDGCGVDDRRQDHDRRAVLIVVHDRDVQRFDQPFFDFEAARRGDVLEAVAAEHRRDANAGLDDLVDVFRVERDREGVDAAELFEEHALALHHGQRSERSDVAEAQYRRTVGDHRHHVALDRELKGLGRIFGDRHRHARDARRIDGREIRARPHRNIRFDVNLAAEVGQKDRVGDADQTRTLLRFDRRLHR